jgi:hypothetical protein
MKIPRHELENNTINSVFDSGSNDIITKKISYLRGRARVVGS